MVEYFGVINETALTQTTESVYITRRIMSDLGTCNLWRCGWNCSATYMIKLKFHLARYSV